MDVWMGWVGVSRVPPRPLDRQLPPVCSDKGFSPAVVEGPPAFRRHRATPILSPAGSENFPFQLHSPSQKYVQACRSMSATVLLNPIKRDSWVGIHFKEDGENSC